MENSEATEVAKQLSVIDDLREKLDINAITIVSILDELTSSDPEAEHSVYYKMLEDFPRHVTDKIVKCHLRQSQFFMHVNRRVDLLSRLQVEGVLANALEPNHYINYKSDMLYEDLCRFNMTGWKDQFKADEIFSILGSSKLLERHLKRLVILLKDRHLTQLSQAFLKSDRKKKLFNRVRHKEQLRKHLDRLS